MDISYAKWLSEQEMEHHDLMNQFQISSIDDSIKGFSTLNSFNLEPKCFENSTQGQTPPKISFCCSSSSSSNLISFGIPSCSQTDHSQSKLYENLNCHVEPNDEAVRQFEKTRKVWYKSRTLLQSEKSVISERKRRENLNKRFIALSALIPGLKKLDKSSILEDAIRYIKELEELIKTLEEEKKKQSEIICGDEYNSSHDLNSKNDSNRPFNKIDVRVSDRSLLIRIHCKKSKDLIMDQLFGELEKLRLTLINFSYMSLDSTTLDITIITKLDVEVSMTSEDLAEKLRLAFLI